MKKKSKSSVLNSSVSPVVLIALVVLVFGLILAVVEGKKSQFLGSDASEGKTPPPRPSGLIQVTRPATQIPSSRTTTNPSYMPKPITSGFPPSGFNKPTGYTR